MGIVTDVILPIALAFIMFTLGLGLTGVDFQRILKQPKDFLAGMLSQIVLLPLVGFGLVFAFGDSLAPELAMGVMLIAAAPGGPTSNILTAWGKGDVALSISMTAVTSLTGLITIPIVIGLAYETIIGGQPDTFSITSLAFKIFTIATLPVLIGMLVRKLAPSITDKMEPVAGKISTGFFILVLIGAIVKERNNVVAYFADAGMITLLLNIIMMFIAFYLAKIFGSGPRQQTAISIECGLQNGTLAITIGTLLFGGGAFIVPAATYSLIMFVTCLVLVRMNRKKNQILMTT